MQITEYAFGCDPFGYLRMAQLNRQAAERRELPDYRLETPRTRLLIEFMKSQGVSYEAWGELVAPHAHHYFPRAEHVAVQYPPGTGLLLALFPQGKAVHGLNQAVIFVYLAVGLLALIVAGRRRAWASAGGVVLALQLGLRIVADIDATSYSINAMLVPMLFSVVLVFVAILARAVAEKSRISWIAAFLAGVCFGFAVIVRLPVLFLLPGMLILLLGTTWRKLISPALIAFGVGVALCGALPLLAHQQRVAGMWYLSTYSSLDNMPPSLSVLESTIPFYFEGGLGSRYNWFLVVTLVGFSGLVLSRACRESGPRAPIGWARLFLAVLVLWGVSTAYFLTHRITILYYQIPATFAAVLILALGAFTLELKARETGEAEQSGERGLCRLLRLLSMAVAFVPGLIALERAWPSRPRAPLSTDVPARQVVFPAELTDDRIWIFADMQTGPLWYYANQSSFKIRFTDPATRALVCRYVFERGEPLYVIRDCAEMQDVLEAIEQLGGILEPRGEADGCPYYLVHWPQRGPGQTPQPTR
jgi:hypothetical protein